jgi:hypothetical protein
MDVAINAANTLYFLPILKLKENEFITDRQALEIYRKALEFFIKAHIGQGLDIYRSTVTSSPADWDYASLIRDLLNIYALKSADNIKEGCKLFAIQARYRKPTRKSCPF